MPEPITIEKSGLLSNQLSEFLGSLYKQSSPPKRKFNPQYEKVRKQLEKEIWVRGVFHDTLSNIEKIGWVAQKVAIGTAAVAAITLGVIGGFYALSSVGALTAGIIAASVTIGIVTTITSVVLNTSNFVLNFNINTTDEELNKQLENQIKRFYGLFGNVVGSSMGYLVCGAIPGALSFAFNPTVAATIMRDLDDEARADILGQVNVISRTAVQTLINSELMRKFKSARRFLKKNPDNYFARIVRQIIGEDDFKKWGDENRPSWSIKKNIIEKRVEALPEGQKQFAEQALEAFGDSCIESGFIIASNIDSYLAAQVLMRDNTLGRQTDVTITLGKRGTPDTPNQPKINPQSQKKKK